MSQRKISPDEAGAMVFPIDTNLIRSDLERLLSIPKCADFVQDLLARASENAAPDNTLVAEGDVLKIFDLVLTQKGVIRAGAPGSQPPTPKFPFANLATGSIATNNAGIQIGGVLPGAAVTEDELAALYRKNDRRVALHETIHHAGRLVYSDHDLAIAVSTMPGRPPLPANGNRAAFSAYWDRE
jgi:hypothetical protein